MADAKFEFKRASRKQAKLRMAITGASGAGKTYSAILLALGLGGKIAMIDTEHGRGEIYSELGEYDAPKRAESFIRSVTVIAIKEKKDEEI